MRYFKNSTGDVFGYETEEEMLFFGPEGLIEMTEEEIELHVNPPASVSVPSKVTMRQARLALHEAGLLVGVETAIDALPEPHRITARIEWDFSSEVFRDKPFVLMLGQALGLSPEDIDQLFISAAMIV